MCEVPNPNPTAYASTVAEKSLAEGYPRTAQASERIGKSHGGQGVRWWLEKNSISQTSRLDSCTKPLTRRKQHQTRSPKSNEVLGRPTLRTEKAAAPLKKQQKKQNEAQNPPLTAEATMLESLPMSRPRLGVGA